MQEVLIYINVFLVLAVAAAGFHRLLMIMIGKDGIFGKWQDFLSWLERRSRTKRPKFTYDFWYKSLGGCDVCSRQRVAEITYLVFIFLFKSHGHWITEGFGSIALNISLYLLYGYGVIGSLSSILSIIINIWLYVLFCGLVMYFGKLLDKRSKKIVREEVIEQTPQTPQPKIRQ